MNTLLVWLLIGMQLLIGIAFIAVQGGSSISEGARVVSVVCTLATFVTAGRLWVTRP